MWFSALWLACGTPAPTAALPDCDPDPRVAGEVRARRIGCSDEILPDGEARQGDWLLENSKIRLAIRDATVSLTQLTGTGGTLIDAALPEGTDALIEAIPSTRGSWFEAAVVEGWSEAGAAGIRVLGTLPDGSEAEVGYTLKADSVELLLTGMDGITVVPMTSSVVVGDALETPVDGDWLLLSPDGEMTDLGGWVEWASPSLLRVGSRSEVYRSRWPTSRRIQGTSDGDWVHVLQGGELSARLDLVDGAFTGWVPLKLDGLQAVASGALPSATRAAQAGVDLPVGARGAFKLAITDEQGAPLPATLTWNDIDYPWLPGDGPIPVPPGEGSGSISAGIAYDSLELPTQQLAGTITLEAQLYRQIGEALLVRLNVVGAPDPTERRSSDQILRAEAARGARWAVLVAEDEIPRVSLQESTAMWMHAQAGSQSGGDHGAPMTWPWSTDTDAPAHGATPWHLLGPLDMLDVMTKAGSRRALIDSAWVAAAGTPLDWAMDPEAFRLDSLEDLETFTSLLDHWVPITPVGPWTWVEGVRESEASTTEAVRGILAGRTTATTGPRLILTVGGIGPGELLSDSIFPTKRARLRVEAAPGSFPTHAAILTDAGELERWPISGDGPQLLDAHTSVDTPNWVLAIAWTEGTDGPWAVSAPVWVGRP